MERFHPWSSCFFLESKESRNVYGVACSEEGGLARPVQADLRRQSCFADHKGCKK